MESNLSAQTATPPTQAGSLDFRHRCAEGSISFALRRNLFRGAQLGLMGQLRRL